jgi:predicted esterase
MKLKLIFTLLTLVGCNITAFSQFERFNSFDELDQLSRKYVQTNKLDSAILAIEYAMKEFPDNDEKARYILDFLYSRTNRDSSALKNWAYGLKKRYFYGLNNWQYENRFKNNPEFDSLAKIDKQIGDSLNDLSHVKYEVVLPLNYSAEKVCPLLFIFHGNGRNLQKAKRVWTSDVIKDKFIVVFLQSYIFMNQYNYKWVQNDDKTDKEFKEIYELILEKYNINKIQIIFSGMSAGGCLAIDYAFNQFVPVSGLVLNCPVIPNVADSLITQYAVRENKLGIITGEKDFALNDQKELINKLDKIGGETKMTINSDIGHQFANDFSTLIDEYLRWVIE